MSSILQSLTCREYLWLYGQRLPSRAYLVERRSTPWVEIPYTYDYTKILAIVEKVNAFELLELCGLLSSASIHTGEIGYANWGFWNRENWGTAVVCSPSLAYSPKNGFQSNRAALGAATRLKLLGACAEGPSTSHNSKYCVETSQLVSHRIHWVYGMTT